MNALWTAVVVLLIFLVVSRLRKRTRQTRARKTAPPSHTISGWQINAYLDPHMPSACLYDHGLQYGIGFRRKEGPTLPHGENCRCEAAPFSFSSTQVFGGALRAIAETRGVIPGLSLSQARQLIDALKKQEAQSLPDTAQAYAAAVDLQQFPTALHEPIARFLIERHKHLKNRIGKPPLNAQPSSESESDADPKELLTAEAMDGK